jgi:hypothetical protein
VCAILAHVTWERSPHEVRDGSPDGRDRVQVKGNGGAGSLGFFVGLSAALVLAATPWRREPRTM